jgi:hypothetical protein
MYSIIYQNNQKRTITEIYYDYDDFLDNMNEIICQGFFILDVEYILGVY